MKLLRDIAAAWSPPPPVRHCEWIPANVRVPREGQSPVLFDLDTYPHALGVLEAFDDPDVREIIMPWAAQGLGKTTLGISLLVSMAANTPRPMLAVRETETATNEKLFAQITATVEACLATRDLLPPPHRRNKEFLNLTHCRIWRGYSGAPGTLSGFPAAVALGSEVSKYNMATSREADPVELMIARLINYPFDSKAIFESTPADVRTCRVTKLARRRGVLMLKRHCPCPHCGHYQLLLFGDADPDTPGLKWDKQENGRSDPQLAEETAWYRCVSGCRIESEDRFELLTHGVWLSDNQSISKATTKAGRITKPGRIRGKRPRASKVVFGDPIDAPFGALYSLAVGGWGFTARAFLDSSRQQFLNSILGAVYDPAPVKIHPHELAERIGVDEPLRVLPAWTSFITVGADVSRIGEQLLLHWIAMAWGRHGRGQLVDFGLDLGVETFAARLLTGGWPLPETGTTHTAIAAGVDSGSFTEAVYEFCRPLPNVWPVKGSSRDEQQPFVKVKAGFVEMFRGGFQRAGIAPEIVRQKQATGAYDLIIPNTDRTQEWLEERLGGFVKRDDPQALTIPLAALTTQPVIGIDLAEQLLGDYQDDRGNWVKRQKAQDFRDALRYAQVMAWFVTANGELWDQQQPLAVPSQTHQTPVLHAGEGRPDGRHWLDN